MAKKFVDQYDITIYCGADFSLSFFDKDDEGNLVDLTGCTVTAMLRQEANSNDGYAFTCTHTDTGGRITLGMDRGTTAQIGYTEGVYDVFVLDTDNVKEKVLWGNATIIPSVTR